MEKGVEFEMRFGDMEEGVKFVMKLLQKIEEREKCTFSNDSKIFINMR